MASASPVLIRLSTLRPAMSSIESTGPHAVATSIAPHRITAAVAPRSNCGPKIDISSGAKSMAWR